MSDQLHAMMDWDTYWRGSRDRAAFAGEGVDHPLVGKFWQHALIGCQRAGVQQKLLDVASGNGAVIDTVQSVFGELSGNNTIDVTCLDFSDAAINSLTGRYPSVEGMVGDAREIPLPDQSFDIATSQFGVEYAGIEAVAEMARLVKCGGTIVLLMHVQGGMIDRECENNFNSIKALRGINFMLVAQKVFSEARTCLQSKDPENSRAAYDAAVQEMRPIFTEFKSILARFGDGTAGGTLLTLYREVDRIHSRIMHHDLDEVLTWLKTMDEELNAYSGRMDSMRQSAVDDDGYKRIRDLLLQREFEITTSEQLKDSTTTAAVAWTLIASRRQETQN